MKSLVPLARFGAVLSAVALLGAYVYFRAGGSLGERAEATDKEAEKNVVMSGSKSYFSSTSMSDGTLVLIQGSGAVAEPLEVQPNPKPELMTGSKFGTVPEASGLADGIEKNKSSPNLRPRRNSRPPSPKTGPFFTGPRLH